LEIDLADQLFELLAHQLDRAIGSELYTASAKMDIGALCRAGRCLPMEAKSFAVNHLAIDSSFLQAYSLSISA
jgi:hypothetical protein